jgi:hypothetical protein
VGMQTFRPALKGDSKVLKHPDSTWMMFAAPLIYSKRTIYLFRLFINHQFFQYLKSLIMKRRNFILLGATGVATVSIPAAFYFLGDVEYDKALADPQSLSLIWDTQTIISTGNKYRSQTPAEDTERSLVKKLSAEPSTLEEKIRKDFETGNTVIVDGWILSKTEARQCALFSITEPK